MHSTIHQAKQLKFEDFSKLPITNEATIDEEYLDSNRHMNVSWYLHLFNQATGGMHKWLDFDWVQLKAKDAGSFVLEGHIRYLNEVLAEEHVTLRTRLIARSAKRVHFLHFMLNDDKQSLAATYEVVVAFMDMKARRMAPYPEPIAQRLDDALAQHQALDWDAPVCGVMRA